MPTARWARHLPDSAAGVVAQDILTSQQLVELDLRSNQFTANGISILAPVLPSSGCKMNQESGMKSVSLGVKSVSFE